MSTPTEGVRPAWVAGKPWTSGEPATVANPADGTIVGQHVVPDPEGVASAVSAAWDARAAVAGLSAADRARALTAVSAGIEARAEEFARLILAENGKPIRWARAEVGRAVSTFRWAAEEARRCTGQLQRLDSDPATPGRLGVIRRFPYGPVLAITPFNFPLNLVAHKVAPAIAVGAPVIVKPAPATPLTALLLGEVLAAADLPQGSWSVLPIGNEATADLVGERRLPVVSFTGSDRVGTSLRRSHPDKHWVLELGGNAAAVVLADWSSDEDLARAAERIATFGTYQAGQSCISVQRVIVDRALLPRFTPVLTEAVQRLATGPADDPSTVVGPMISAQAAQRVTAWIAEAVAAGGRVLTGGTAHGTTVAPTLLADVPATAKVCAEEVFGPVLVLSAADGTDEAFAAVNASRFGLQAGVFTHDIGAAFRAQAELEVGGVIIGDVPSYRADQMPYGGVKDSGVGREGVQAAMRDLSYERVMVLTGLTL